MLEINVAGGWDGSTEDLRRRPAMISKPPSSSQPVRTLHSVGHLLRGGIEKWLFQALTAQLSRQYEHHVLVRTPHEEAFTSAFRAAGIPVFVCSNFTNPIRYALDLRRLIKEHGPYDILHVHGSSFSGLLTLALAKPMGIRKTIVHSHNDVRPLLRGRGYLYRAYVAGVLKVYRALADFGFAASALAAESMFGAHWKNDQRWELLYYGVDCKHFAKPKDTTMRAKLGIPEEAFVIGHTGRFHEQKNHAFLLDVIQAAAAICPEVHCLLIGDGPLHGSVTAEVHRRELQGRFTFVRDTLAVSDYMISVMDCFVFPSRYEGLGLVVVEAQAAGLPCLISDRVPLEAIVDASLVRVYNLEWPAAEWAEAVLSLKNLEPEPHSAVSVTRVESSRFNLNHCISTMKSRYTQLASRQAGGLTEPSMGTDTVNERATA
jgi:glycosyltransferase involved in cell wall biosynthesis